MGDVYEEQDLNKKFIRGLTKSIEHSMRGYYIFKKSARLQNLTFHATLLLKLQVEAQPRAWFEQVNSKN